MAPQTPLYLGPPETPYRGGHLLANLVLFGRVCRGIGLSAGPDRILEVARALRWIELGSREEFYHTLRALMVNNVSQLALFDEAFSTFWQVPAREATALDLRSLGERRRRRTRVLPAGSEPTPSGTTATETSSMPAFLPTYSNQEVLKHRDFARMTGEELRQAREMIAQLDFSLASKRSRRLVPGGGRRLDTRRLLRSSFKTGGEVVWLPWRGRRHKPRPLVLICDISGSMERYTRLLLHFCHTLAGELNRIESFVFSTRLSRITRTLRLRSVDRALQELGTSVDDWAGGTQIGFALKTFNYRWSRRVLGGGAVVLLISDGWDRGDSQMLARETARLQRSCYRLIWLNPLLGGPQYEPLTQGARAMLPHVDDFLSVRTLASLEKLGQVLSRLNNRPHSRRAWSVLTRKVARHC